VKLNARGVRVLSGAPSGLRVKVRIVSHDDQGNGWRTTEKLRLKR